MLTGMIRAPAGLLLSAIVVLCGWAPNADARTIAGRAPTMAALSATKPVPTDSRSGSSSPVPDPSMQLSSLSCAASTDCSVTGVFEDGLGDSQGLFATETAGRWGATSVARLPAGASTDPFRAADGGGLVDISCPGDGDCVAVGRYTDATGIDRALAFTESDGHWARGTRLLLPRNAIRAPMPKTGATEDVDMYSVGCASVGNCVAVGTYETDAEVWQGLIVSEAGGHWRRGTEAPLPAGAPAEGQDAVLLSTSCTTGSSCTIAGDYVNAQGHQEALLVSGRGPGWPGSGSGGWTVSPSPATPADANTSPNVTPTSISCSDGGDCAVVGTYINPLDNSLGLLLSESGGSYAGGIGVQLPAGAAPAGTVGDQTAVLSSVNCPAAGSCTAVGWYFDNYENGQGLLVSQKNGVWQPATQLTLPLNAVGGLEKQSAGLDWVSCASVGNCLATGVYTDLGYNSQGLIVSEQNGYWQPAVEAPLPRDAAGTQSAATDQADCSAVGDCDVIGEYYNNHGRLLGYTLSETAGHWGTPTPFEIPGPTADEVRLSLAAIAEPYGQDGRRASVLHHDGFKFTYTAVTAGRATVDWYAQAGDAQVLIASGGARVSGPRNATLTVGLTAAGAAMLAAGQSLPVRATVSFTPRSHRLHIAETSRQFTLS
jgi:hypothetical protein